MARQALLALFVALAGCAGASRDSGLTGETIGSTTEAMVGGTPSTSSQDSVVWVQQGDEDGCSGTFIAPNLVLTARHCVADPDSITTTDCVGYGATVDPSVMTIKVGKDAGFNGGTTIGTGVKIYTPKISNLCSYDIALIQLANDVQGQKTSPIRFTAIAPNEPTIAVGYGVDENGNQLAARMQRQTTVLGVGPANVNYTENDGTVFKYTAPSGDVVTGESTCFGDSGGPLFDLQGNIVAMTSRGPLNAPTGGDHGNSCADMISIYAGAKFNEAVIRSAATQAGHPLPADPVATTESAGDDDDDSAAGDDDDSTGSTTKSAKKAPAASSSSPSADAVPSEGGCSATGQTTSTSSLWLVALAIFSCRRLSPARRRRQSRSR